jgi:hypothetical protein
MGGILEAVSNAWYGLSFFERCVLLWIIWLVVGTCINGARMGRLEERIRKLEHEMWELSVFGGKLPRGRR